MALQRSLLIAASLIALTACNNKFTLVEKTGGTELNQALALQERGQSEQALDLFQQAARSPYDDVRARALTEIADYRPRKRIALLQEAHELGYEGATLRLANAYRDGSGVTRDLKKAAMLYASIKRKSSRAAAELARLKDEHPELATIAGQDSEGPGALEWLLRDAKRGDDDAMLNLARMYRDGSGMEKDTKLAEQWYRRAIDKGNENAAIELATLWLEPDNARPDADAELLLKQVIAKGNSRAMLELARWYERSGQRELAGPLYAKAAAKGNYAAQTALAVDTLEGRRFAPGESHREAITTLRKTASMGDSEALYELGKAYRYGRGVPANASTAFQYFTDAAAAGSSSAKAELASAYMNGRGTALNQRKAVELYKDAANAGSTNALVGLGNAYARGLGVPANAAEAFRYYMQAAELGSTTAYRRVAEAYANGNGVAASQSEAARWMEKAAQEGSRSSMEYMAYAYLGGKGVGKSQERAFHWFKRAAEDGSERAMAELAASYENGWGTSKDSGKASEWYAKVDQLNPRRVIALANEYTSGSNGTVSHERAFPLYRHAALQGDKKAIKQVATAYRTGQGTKINLQEAAQWESKLPKKKKSGASTPPPNADFVKAESLVQQGRTKEAIEWYRKAAKNGDGESMVRLAQAYGIGNGVDMDVTESFKWFKQAAQAGHPEGQYQLGLSYAQGYGTSKDVNQAREWLSKAEKNGYPLAGDMLQNLPQ